MVTVLIAEDEPEVRDYLGLALSCEGYKVEFAQDGEEVLSHLERDGGAISLLLLDLIMPRKDGFETLKMVRCGWPALPVITLSGSCTPANVATVLKNGAVDFLSKPIPRHDLILAVETALGASSASPSIQISTPPERPAGSGLSSAASWSRTCELFSQRLGASDVPVLLRGETGAGKEVLARRLHAQSKRSKGPFLKLNCAALPSELVESELFGYEKGAFTGAVKSTPGKFEMANGGTILLDEIGDMDFRLQAKLLQVLQDQEFIRLGSKDTCRVDVRVMAATHCDLEQAIADGRFREDLYYRLNIVEIQVPPLRERKDEIIGLTQAFLRKYSPTDPVEITPQLKQALLDHNWPGNVRELENVIRKFLILRNVDVIARELRTKAMRAVAISGQKENDFSRATAARERTMPREAEPVVHVNSPGPAPNYRREGDPQISGRTGLSTSSRLGLQEPGNMPRSAEKETAAGTRDDLAHPHSSTLLDLDNARKKAERDAIVSALTSTLWNRKKAAALLKIDYKALLYKMKKLGLGDSFQ
jgi:two-component system, NtrC family, response regulator AtoC